MEALNSLSLAAEGWINLEWIGLKGERERLRGGGGGGGGEEAAAAESE
jgi:hypothetical protein